MKEKIVQIFCISIKFIINFQEISFPPHIVNAVLATVCNTSLATRLTDSLKNVNM